MASRRKLIKNLVIAAVLAAAGIYLALTGRGHHRHRYADDDDETAPGSSAPVTPPGR